MEMEMEAWEIIYDIRGGILDFRLIDLDTEILDTKFNEGSPYRIYHLYKNKEAYQLGEYKLLFEGQIIRNYVPKH